MVLKQHSGQTGVSVPSPVMNAAEVSAHSQRLPQPQQFSSCQQQHMYGKAQNPKAAFNSDAFPARG